jgi:predicted nuclease of predicted toxin-antitoxin system
VKLLADMGISMATVHALREAGEEVVHLREKNLHTMPDDQILAKAIREQRVILTCDLDFGEILAAGGGSVPSVILFRTRNQTPKAVTPRLFQVLRTYRTALEAGAIVIVEDGGFRLRRLPIQRS